MHIATRFSMLSALSAAFAMGQVTRTEIVKPTTPLDDSKANSASVPDAYAVSGNFERIVVIRLKFQADLLAGMEKMVKEQKIKNAALGRARPDPGLGVPALPPPPGGDGGKS